MKPPKVFIRRVAKYHSRCHTIDDLIVRLCVVVG